MTTCPNCQTKFDYQANMKRLPSEVLGIIEVGVHCPHCKFWVVGYFTTKELEDLRASLAIAKSKQQLFRAPTIQNDIARKHDELQAQYEHLKKARIRDV